jgi:uncharacterized phage protein (TIGR02216 family)
MRPFPWDEAMRFGFGTLHLSSRDFWGLSPRELAAAFTALSGRGAPPSRARLDELMRNFPDKEQERG